MQNKADYMVVLCREVNPYSGAIAVYEIKDAVTNSLITKLTLRARLNQNMRYFTTLRNRREGVWHDDYYKLLKRRKLTDEDITNMGGLVELR